jgi:hypothetical protein
MLDLETWKDWKIAIKMKPLRDLKLVCVYVCVGVCVCVSVCVGGCVGVCMRAYWL